MYGVSEAVFIHNLYWWIAKNEANGRHYYDGKNWTYNSMEAFAKLFPFWSTRQVRRIIKKLHENGALHIGNYNKKGFDRTQWYALDQTVTSIYLNGHFHLTKRSLPFDQTVTPIPDSKPDSKPFVLNTKENDEISKTEIETFFQAIWKAYPKKRGQRQHISYTEEKAL